MSAINSNNVNHNRLPGISIIVHDSLIHQYMSNEYDIIINKEYVNTMKLSFNIRILLLNSRGYRPSDSSKIYMLKEASMKYQIDILFLNETNTKQSTKNQDKIKRNLKLLGCKTETIYTKSKA